MSIRTMRGTFSIFERFVNIFYRNDSRQGGGIKSVSIDSSSNFESLGGEFVRKPVVRDAIGQLFSPCFRISRSVELAELLMSPIGYAST